MGITNYISGMAGQQLINWFADISQKLNSQNFYNGEFTPNITNLTGSPTITGEYFRFSKFVHINIDITGTSQTTSSKVDNLPYTATSYGIAIISNWSLPSFIGHGYVNKGTKDMVLYNWNVTSQTVIINGTYKIMGL